jgi:tRNA A-37 threonylcarbamoyl transferase component Bud32/energy-coupling factor transporter ATP-binding protein EcfA2
VLPDRSQLDSLASDTLKETAVEIAWNRNRRTYVLRERVGRGATAVAWRATDDIGRVFAIKFVLRAEYASHSLDAEARRANSLESRLFAKVDFFGEPSFAAGGQFGTEFYAIVVDWISGLTLREYVEKECQEAGPTLFRRLARDLCEVLQALKSKELSHNDLHDQNILVRPERDALTNEEIVRIVIIDSGQLKTDQRRIALLEQWQEQMATLESVFDGQSGLVADAIEQYRKRLAYFGRTDQEWVVYHLCTLYNCMRRFLSAADPIAKRFIRDLPVLLRLMMDGDPSRRLDDPTRMHEEIERVWSQSTPQPKLSMISPFDLPSAELIRSDRQLMALFSDKYPRLEACRSNAPVYLYGPRGCGKSTILRSLSLKAVLDSENPTEELKKIPFIGIYISSSQELRSRFWLMRQDDFDVLESHVVRYFNLLLIEGVVETLDCILQWDRRNEQTFRFGLSEDIAAQCVAVIRTRAGLDAMEGRYAGLSHFVVLKNQLRRNRDALWLQILDRKQSDVRPDAQMVFDICQQLEEVWPALKMRRLVFLIDDYSNQRIPVALQKKLNQAITFAKQGTPIFKVTSEYDGVDLEGIQEGREVNEINVGFEYVTLQEQQRHRFLQNMIELRFKYVDAPVDLASILPPSGLTPAIPMARAIREAFQQKKRFLYHGVDTISDLCSGDFAMGIDLVRRIFEQGRVNWRSPKPVSETVQDAAIREYTKHEYEHIRFHSRDGRRKFEIADKLCWLSKECVLTKEREKEGQPIPVVKNHLDIAEEAVRHLEEQYPENAELLHDLVRRGILFPLQASRSRQARDATRRYMIRRILLARYTTALGRDVPIRIDDVQRLVFFLTEPTQFVKNELEATSSSHTTVAGQPAQKHLPGFDT